MFPCRSAARGYAQSGAAFPGIPLAFLALEGWTVTATVDGVADVLLLPFQNVRHGRAAPIIRLILIQIGMADAVSAKLINSGRQDLVSPQYPCNLSGPSPLAHRAKIRRTTGATVSSLGIICLRLSGFFR